MPGRGLHEAAWAVAVGALLALVVFGASSAWPTFPTLWDYGSFYASGRAIAEGLDPYGTQVVADLQRAGFEATTPDLNPPVWLPYFWILAMLPPWAGFVGHVCVAALAYAALVTAYGRRRGALFAGIWLGSTVLWETLAMGQVYVEVTLALCAADELFDRRPNLAALLVGVVVAAKPNLALVLPVLALCGHYRAAVGVVLGAVLAIVVSLPVGGPRAWTSWWTVVAGHTLPQSTINVSLWRLGAIPAVLALVGLGWMTWRSRRTIDAQRAAQLGVALGILFSPVAWPCYAMFLLPTFARDRRSMLVMASIVLCLPANLVFASPSFALSLVYPAALLTTACALAWSEGDLVPSKPR